MNFTEEYALKIGEKVLRDTGLQDDGKYLFKGENTWLVSFPYGTDINGKSRASMHIVIFDNNGIAFDISYKNGRIILDYDKENDKYSVKKQRP